jgi:hypothetical protein
MDKWDKAKKVRWINLWQGDFGLDMKAALREQKWAYINEALATDGKTDSEIARLIAKASAIEDIERQIQITTK